MDLQITNTIMVNQAQQQINEEVAQEMETAKDQEVEMEVALDMKQMRKLKMRAKMQQLKRNKKSVSQRPK